MHVHVHLTKAIIDHDELQVAKVTSFSVRR